MGLFKNDLKIAYRNGFLLITVAIAFLYAALVMWVLPIESNEEAETMVILDSTTDKIWKPLLSRFGETFLFASTEEELLENVEKRRTIGIHLSDEEWITYQQGYENAQTIRLLQATLENVRAVSTGVISIEELDIREIQENAPPINITSRAVPVLIATDIVLLGFFFSAAMVFNEKKEGSLIAVRVSPLRSLPYLLSKILVNEVITLLFLILFLLPMGLLGKSFFPLLLIVSIASFFVSCLGIFIARFFESVSEFLYLSLAITLLCMIPALPSFGIPIKFPGIEWIPSYYVFIESFNLLFSPEETDTVRAVLMLSIESFLIFCVTWGAYHRKYFQIKTDTGFVA
jgi:hypothetical protein